MTEDIQRLLSELETERGIEILYACESGSRAWGFHSPDSDYDIRFLYRRPVTDCYLISSPADTIEIPIENDLDPGGWELRKALGLLAKSNGALIEWLHSPMVYRANEDFLGEMRGLARKHLSRRGLANHYRGMAHRSMESGVKKEKPAGKAYLYALRAVLSMQHAIEKGTPPPVAFAELLPLVSDEIRKEIEQLLKWKEQAREKDSPGRLSPLDDFLTERLTTFDEMESDPPSHADFNTTLHRWTLWP